MHDFVLLFHQPDTGSGNLSEVEKQAAFERWDDWFGSIAEQGKLNNRGMLDLNGKVLREGNVTTDGPFVEIRERLIGFIVVKADSLEEAAGLAHGCPILDINGSVEIRSSFPGRPCFTPKIG